MQPQQPYTPPQQPIQPVAPRKKRQIGNFVTWGMFALGGLLVLSVLAWVVILLLGKTNSDTGKTQAGAAAVLEPLDVAPVSRTINSKLGIQVLFNSRELEGFGFADEVTFSGTDLDEAKAYTVIRVRPVETSEATRSQVALESPELRVTSSINEAYWEKLSAKKEYKDMSKVDILVDETVKIRKQDKSVEASDAEVKTINDIDYRKIVFTAKDEQFGVTTERREDCYITVQNDRPYAACISGVRDANFAVLPALEQVLSQITYKDLDTSVLMSADSVEVKKDTKMLDGKQDEKVTATSATKNADKANDKESTNETQGAEGESAEKAEDAKTENEQADTNAQSQQKVPEYLSSTADFVSFAKAVPATVRVGTIYCADIKLELPDGLGEGPVLTDACIDKAGTGFFVSREGLVATAGSVAQVKPQDAITAYIVNAPTSEQALQRLQRVLGYMVQGRSIMQTDADALVAGVEERNPEAIAKVHALSSRIVPEDMAVTKESYKYAIQLADKPITVNGSGDGATSFAYTDTVLEAELEGKVYDISKTQQQIYQGEASGDTAILKMKKASTYPTLRLALTGEGIADKSVINIVGLPMYAVGSLSTAQFRSTPMYRSGQVAQTFSGEAGQKVRMISTPSHAGLAGAPALDQKGDVVGMATYGNLNCQDKQCFASTVVRDTVGIADVAKQRNITLQPVSAVSDTWNKAVAQLVRGNYRQATQLFTQSSQLYPQNYHAARFAAYSKGQYGSATDTSTMNAVVGAMKILALISICLLLVLAIAKVILKVFAKPHTETQYGQMAHGEYIDPSQWQQQNIGIAPQSQNPRPATDIPQSTQWHPGLQSQAPLPQQPAQPTVFPQEPAAPVQPQQNPIGSDTQPPQNPSQPQQ